MFSTKSCDSGEFSTVKHQDSKRETFGQTPRFPPTSFGQTPRHSSSTNQVVQPDKYVQAMGLYILNGFQLKTSRPGRELRGWLPLPCSTSPRHRARPRGARRVRADRLGRADPRSLCLGGGAAPHGHRQRACACARRAVRPGDGEEPQYRAAGRGPEPRPGLEPPRTTRRAAIQDYLLQRVEHGKVQDRAGVVAALHKAGLAVPRGRVTTTSPCETRPPTSGGG